MMKACTISAGNLEAVFLPARGMLGASLRYRGTEILRRIDDLDAAAAKGSTAGIPLLYPWANRLSSLNFRAAGKDVSLDPASSLLHFDEHGLPMHGVPWSMLVWDVTEAKQDFLAAGLEWKQSELLALFPFPHRVDMTAVIHPKSLTLDITITAGPSSSVPVSFGFHPYFGFADFPRAQWRLMLPAMHKISLDQRGIPTGREEPFPEFNAPLGELSFDNGFALLDDPTSLSLSAGGRRITIEMLTGYRYAQVFAPKDKDYVALEPMTAPANALVSGRNLRIIDPGGKFHATFRIQVE